MRCPQVGPGRQASIFCGSSLERATAADLLAQRLRVEHDSFKFEDLDRALPAEEAGRFDLLGGGLVRRGVVQGIDGCEIAPQGYYRTLGLVAAKSTPAKPRCLRNIGSDFERANLR